MIGWLSLLSTTLLKVPWFFLLNGFKINVSSHPSQGKDTLLSGYTYSGTTPVRIPKYLPRLFALFPKSKQCFRRSKWREVRSSGKRGQEIADCPNDIFQQSKELICQNRPCLVPTHWVIYKEKTVFSPRLELSRGQATTKKPSTFVPQKTPGFGQLTFGFAGWSSGNTNGTLPLKAKSKTIQIWRHFKKLVAQQIVEYQKHGVISWFSPCLLAWLMLCFSWATCKPRNRLVPQGCHSNLHG